MFQVHDNSSDQNQSKDGAESQNFSFRPPHSSNNNPDSLRNRLLERVEELSKHLQDSDISASEALEWATLDGCITTDNPAVWSLVNAHFASGAGYTDGIPREVIPIGIPGQFTLESVCHALASRLGRRDDFEGSDADFIREHLQTVLANREVSARGTEAIHIAIQLEPVQKLLELAIRLPDNLRELDRRIWEPIEKAKNDYRAAINELGNFLDELNEEYLATFSLCLPKPHELVGEAIRDTIWP